VRRGTIRVDELELWFIGRHLDVARRAGAGWPALAPAIHYAGAVPRAAALDAQRRATVLLALGSPDPAFDGDVPTKVFEYLDAGRPVLAVASPSSAVAALLQETRGGCVAGSPDAIAAALNRWHADWRRHGRAAAGGDPDAVARYERRRLVGEFAAVLDRLYYGLCAEGRRSHRGP
jgi:glycosyltransferase involved in cell wall biosynthesis